ncbi:PREDICTED: uncharacterized protein LOC106807564 [Priapulus caudatus]|uniref:Uncharacterized protein LOC106807564 n=1 Tax=Priapulus caudatus TaxID=37621 RepID=A0ABM1DZQ0_PRICU|nr:PREDICTED: uncharacterized protein LOC106807564 [Priapulus caudatus]
MKEELSSHAKMIAGTIRGGIDVPQRTENRIDIKPSAGNADCTAHLGGTSSAGMAQRFDSLMLAQVRIRGGDTEFVRPGLIEVPTCRLRIVPGMQPYASDARVLKLGDTATMVVSINNKNDVFDIFVTNCYGHDGLGQTRLHLIDDGGCPTSDKFIKPAVYDRTTHPGQTHMYSHFKVFKFPDAQDVYLQCQCMVCYERCYRPQCDGSPRRSNHLIGAASKQPVTGRIFGRNKRAADGASRDDVIEEENSQTKIEQLEETKIFQKFKVEIPGEERLSDDPLASGSGTVKGQHAATCVPQEVFIAVLVTVVAILLVSITISTVLYVRMQRLARLNEKLMQKTSITRAEIVRRSRIEANRTRAPPGGQSACVNEMKVMRSSRAPSDGENLVGCAECKQCVSSDLRCSCENQGYVNVDRH